MVSVLLARRLALVALLLVWSLPVGAIGIRPHIPLAQTTGVHYVSSTGVGSGPGTFAAPWTLAYALSGAGGQVTAGETVWIRGGTYSLGSTQLTVTLVGTASAPIILRAYPTERAILDWSALGSANYINFHTSAEYVWFWDLELRNSVGGVREGATLAAHDRGGAFYLTEPGLKIINCILHDWEIPIGQWAGATGSELAGNLMYYNGMHETANPGARDTGYGVYQQTANSTAGQRHLDNIIFKNYAYAIHAYGSNAAYHRSLLYEGNAYFSTGQIAAAGPSTRTFLLGGEEELNCQDDFLIGNFLYGPRNGGGQLLIGFSGPCVRSRLFNNYVFDRNASGDCVTIDNDVAGMPAILALGNVAAGNTFCSSPSGMATAYPLNTYVDTSVAYPTTGNVIVLRPNVYEPGRAHVIVYNWTLASSVSVDLAAANFSSGDTYAIYDAQDYFGAAVATGTYTGSAVAIPMTNTSVATPYGTVGTAPTNTAPQFGAFVVKKTSA